MLCSHFVDQVTGTGSRRLAPEAKVDGRGWKR